MELITPAEFSANYELNLKEHIEVKGGSFQARYISWAIAQKLLREKHPTLSVDFERAASGDILHHLGDNIYLLPFLTNGENRTPAIFFRLWTIVFLLSQALVLWQLIKHFKGQQQR